MKPVARRLVVALLLLAVGGLGLRWHLNRAADAPDGDFNLYGNIDIRQAGLAFTEQERIEAVLVQEGERVVSGQVLARLRTDGLTARIKEITAQINAQTERVKQLEAGSRPQEIEQVRAEVEALKSKVQNARNNFERIQRTSGAGATSAQALDDARTQLEVSNAQLKAREKFLELAVEGPRKEEIAAAKSSLDALKASLELFQVRLNDMILKAPADGVIQNRILEPGELAAPNRPVFTLALTDPKWVRAYVPEPLLGKVHPNQKAKIFSDAFADQPFDGWVGSISPVAEFTPKSVETTDLRTQLVYEVRVFVTDKKDQLRLGMPVTVKLTEPAAQNDTGKASSP